MEKVGVGLVLDVLDAVEEEGKEGETGEGGEDGDEDGEGGCDSGRQTLPLLFAESLLFGCEHLDWACCVVSAPRLGLL